MTKYLLISGSPRKGNTDFALQTLFDEIKGDKELVFLKDKNIKHCIGCLSCQTNSKCLINDDIGEILDKMLKSDVLIIGKFTHISYDSTIVL